MFLSQKGSLGRNPMINRVGQRLLQLFEGASAAYSLRDLASNIASVVRVRRASDNSEKDFSAADVSSGAMTQWVNAQIVPPLDVRELVDGERTGALIPAAAAYSLRNLSTSYTGNVVDVRRSSDDAEDSFTAAQVADGTLTDFVNVGKDYVGYAAFQNSNTSNVNLSSSFTLEASESWSIKFGYIGGTTVTGLFGGSASNTGFWFANQNTIGLTDDSDSYQALSFGSALALKLGQHYEMEFFNTPSEGVRVTVDGVTMSTTPKIYGDITLNKIGVSRGRNGDRVIENVRIDLNGDGTLDYSYAGDGNQASNWTDRVGSNNGTPSAQVLTYNNEYTDGFVTQWYDQSGNANHATQGTDASQPKIVDAGSLVSGGIDFDGVDDTLTLSSPLGITSTASHFAVTNLNSTGTTDTFFDNRDSSTDGYSIRTNDASNINFDWLSSDAEVARVSGEGLYYFNKTSSQAQSGANGGTLVTASDSGSISVTTVPRIGARSFTSALNFFGGTINEFIIYGSDQSDNRTAFEANIGETYGIDLPSGVDTGYDQVDGFVETWYDQSGNGNDAVQLTAGSQPKIVDAGVLLTTGGNPSVDFYNNSLLETSAFTDGSASSIFSVINNQSANSTRKVFYTKLDFPNKGVVWNYRGDRSAGEYDFVSYDGSTNSLTSSDSTSPFHFVSSTIINSDKEVFINGTSKATSSDTFVLDDGSLALGDAVFGTGFDFQEIIIYGSDQSANRVAIETNINNQYNIY